MLYALKIVSPDGTFLSWLRYCNPSKLPHIYTDALMADCEARHLNRDRFELNRMGRAVNCSHPAVAVHYFESEADLPWQCRESKRFEKGGYKRLPWVEERWFGKSYLSPKEKVALQELHFAHVSMDDVTKIAFTENEDKGKRDIQTRMKPGRYLSRFYSDVLSEKDIQYWAGVFASHYDTGELHLATTREDIRWVYENGPNSCMSHHISDYATNGVHPCEVYAAGDLAIAYLKSEKRVAARAVVWPEKKIASRIYGDHHRLNSLLDFAGYNFCPSETDWFGARLLKIPAANSGFVAPYTDFHHEFDERGEYLVCVNYGEYRLQQTNGTTHEGMTCYHCEDTYDEDDGHYVGDDFVCDCCRDRYYFYCDGCNEYHNTEDGMWETARGRIICSDCYLNDYATCKECDDIVRDYDTQETREGTIVCDGCSTYLNTTPCGELTTNDEPLTVCDCHECDRERDRIEEEEGEAVSLPQTGRTDDPCQMSLI